MRQIFKKVFVAMTLSLSLAAAAYPQSHPANPVTVTIHRVRQIGDLEGPLGGRPDFRASITIDDERRLMPEVSGRDITPGSLWFFRKEGCGNLVRINIKLFEDDSARHDVSRRDDHCDINPRRGVKELNLTYNRLTGRISGDVSGRSGDLIRVRGAGDNNRAEIWFSVR
jgi:hypothetical protein